MYLNTNTKESISNTFHFQDILLGKKNKMIHQEIEKSISLLLSHCFHSKGPTSNYIWYGHMANVHFELHSRNISCWKVLSVRWYLWTKHLPSDAEKSQPELRMQRKVRANLASAGYLLSKNLEGLCLLPHMGLWGNHLCLTQC